MLAHDEQKRVKAGNSAYTNMLSLYNEDVLAPKILDIINQLINPLAPDDNP